MQEANGLGQKLGSVSFFANSCCVAAVTPHSLLEKDLGDLRVISSGRSNTRGKDFGGCFPPESLARTSIEFVGDGVELLLRHLTDNHAFRKVMPQKAIRVFVRAPLP